MCRISSNRRFEHVTWTAGMQMQNTVTIPPLPLLSKITLWIQTQQMHIVEYEHTSGAITTTFLPVAEFPKCMWNLHIFLQSNS